MNNKALFSPYTYMFTPYFSLTLKLQKQYFHDKKDLKF